MSNLQVPPIRISPSASIPGASCGSLSATHGRILDISEYIEKDIKPGWCGIYHSSQAHCLGNPRGYSKVASKAGTEKRAHYTSQKLADLVENNNINKPSSLTTF